MRRSIYFLLGFLPLFALAKADAQSGGGVIVLSETLLAVEAHERTATVRASNDTGQRQRYRVSIVDMVMGAEGQLSAPEEDGALAHSASSWVIATPRSLELDPGESQLIRLLIRRPAGLEVGEYRAHLKISQEPPPSHLGGLEEAPSEEGMAFQITTVYSLSLPVVVRHGEPKVSATLADARLLDADRLALTVERRGNASFRGFAHGVSGSASATFPITIYRERQEVALTYSLKELEGTDGPLTLTLYEGTAPRRGKPMPSESLGSLTVAR